jgi:tRNA (cytidine/uridine-2'-O-)-methyltransferase
MRLALYQPDIPQNTGTILRLAACLGVAVDIIQPVGFDMTDRALKRAGLDYLDYAELRRHVDWAAFRATHRAAYC